MARGARGLVLDYFSFVNFLAIFTIARPLFTQRSFSHGFFFFEGVIEMVVKNFVVGDFSFVINLLVVISLQSENDEIL